MHMDAMVTARVPVELKDQVTALLRQNGSSPTELVNSAFEFYLETQRLPKERKISPGTRKLTTAQRTQLARALDSLAFSDADATAQVSVADVVALLRKDDYAALS